MPYPLRQFQSLLYALHPPPPVHLRMLSPSEVVLCSLEHVGFCLAHTIFFLCYRKTWLPLQSPHFHGKCLWGQKLGSLHCQVQYLIMSLVLENDIQLKFQSDSDKIIWRSEILIFVGRGRFVVLGTKPGLSCMLGEYWTTKPYPWLTLEHFPNDSELQLLIKTC